MTGQVERTNPMTNGDERARTFFHAIFTDTCDHDFKGFRAFPDGNGGESVCTKCGMGAMAHTLRSCP